MALADPKAPSATSFTIGVALLFELMSGVVCITVVILPQIFQLAYITASLLFSRSVYYLFIFFVCVCETR